MQCVILAGGLGTRMQHLTGLLPKNMIPVAGEPFVAHQLRWLSRHGVDDVVMSIGRGGDALRQYLGHARAGVRIAWVEDGAEPLGTGGPLQKAAALGLLQDRFLVLYGDSFLPIDFNAVMEAAAPHEVMMAVCRHTPGNVRVENGKVALYQKDPPAALPWIDYGVTAWTLPLVPEMFPTAGRHMVETAYHTLSRQGRLAAYPVTQRFYEVGSPGGLADFEEFIRATTADTVGS